MAISGGPELPPFPAPALPPIPPSAVVLDQGASGIGDGLLGLLAAHGLAAESSGQIYYRVSDASRPWVDLFVAGATLGRAAKLHTHEPTPGAVQMNLGYPEEWASRLSLGRRVDRYCRNVGAKAPVVPPLRDAEWVKSLGAAFAGRIALAPWSNDADRSWPLANWIDLERLLNADGWPTVVIGRAGSPAGGFRGRAALGLPPEWVAGILLNARLLIGNDSGASHLGGILGVPTMALCRGDYDGDAVYGAYPNATAVDWRQVPEKIQYRARDLVTPTAVGTLPELFAVMRTRLAGYSNEMGRVTREVTMPWLFEEIARRFPAPRIVETGCTRSAEDWSAGYATWLFGAYLELAGTGHLTSVDNDPSHLATARRLCREWSRITYVESCSAAYLTARAEPIDVAYLDSMDTWHPGHAEHGLAEARAVAPLMSPRGLIAFDDTPPDGQGGWRGKGRLAVAWLLDSGWRVHPVSDYQTVLERDQ